MPPPQVNIEAANSSLEECVENVSSQNVEKTALTKKGLPRKRQKSLMSPCKRKAEKWNRRKNLHMLKEPCNKQCTNKHCSQFSEEQRAKINAQFWELKPIEQKWFIYNHTSVHSPKRRRSKTRNRSFTAHYSLSLESGKDLEVCKKFFLTTLGFAVKDDRITRNVIAAKQDSSLCAPKPDMRGKTASKRAFDKTLIESHIESYNPTISHYRREHAPNRRYLPSDISIRDMHKDFVEKLDHHKISYELYRKVVARKNISFVKLGHEECWSCEKRDTHEKSVGHKKDNLVQLLNCDICCEWKIHNEKYKRSREEYQKDATNLNETEGNLFVSVDLQKVISES